MRKAAGSFESQGVETKALMTPEGMDPAVSRVAGLRAGNPEFASLEVDESSESTQGVEPNLSVIFIMER